MSEVKKPTVVTRKSASAPTPASLRSQATLTVQTREAQRLINGRDQKDKPAIIGLLAFGNRMRLIWLAAEHDDPYADWTLLLIEENIEKTRSLMQENIRNLTEAVNSMGYMGKIRIDIACSLQPIEFPLQFSNPYGYMGGYLIADYDELARTVFTARHVAVIDRDQANDILNSAGKAIRRTFHLATAWRYTGVTREDLRQMNQAAARAKQLMGEIAEDVVEGRRRARRAPTIKQRSTGTQTTDESVAESTEPDTSAQDTQAITRPKIARKEVVS